MKCLLPVVRAMTAKELMAKHGLRQNEVASLLGVSQSAVSLYCRKIRGRAIDLEAEREIMVLIGDLASSLADGGMLHADHIERLCEVCRMVRSKGLMCNLHKSFDPDIDVETCRVCSAAMARC